MIPIEEWTNKFLNSRTAKPIRDLEPMRLRGAAKSARRF
jgi:hypothetical protein